jgi:hypothetical protein
MNGIEKQAAFYRGYLTDERSLIPLTIVLATVVAVWLLAYVVFAVAGGPRIGGAGCAAASVTFIHDRPAASAPIRRDSSARAGRSFRPSHGRCRGAANPATNLLLISP